MRGSSKAVRMLTDAIERNDTQFGTRIADNTTALTDLPSTYPVNSERYELVTEGTVDTHGTVADTDQTNQIADNENFGDEPGRYDLSTNGAEGDAIELRGRKRLSYQPNYELLWGAAFYMQETLNAGHRIEVAFASPDRDNGYFVGIEPDSREAFIRNGGVRIDAAEWGERHDTEDAYEREFDETQPQVIRQFVSWYGDGAARTELTHANSGAKVKNDLVARVANTDTVATEEINLQISVRLECTADSSPQTLSSMSFGALNRGDSSVSNREKGAIEWDLGGDIGSTEYTPLMAIRRRPGYEQVPTHLSQTQMIPEDRMELLAVAFNQNAAGLTVSDWDVPPQMDAANSAVERTTSFTEFPTDANGQPAGRQLSVLVADGAGGNQADRTEADIDKEFYENEVVGILARTKTASNSAVDVMWNTRQEW